MTKSKTKQMYGSLEELRRDKRKVQRSLNREAKALKTDAVDLVLPSNNAYLSSDFNYMRYIGYAITAYKTFNTVRKITGFFARRRRK